MSPEQNAAVLRRLRDPGPYAAASFDQGGEVTPRRTTRYMCKPISAKIAPGINSMWIA